MQIESETLPRAQYVKRLEVEPPGAQPHRMRPITSLGGNPQALAKPHDMSGISPNWQSQPQRNARFLEVHTALTCGTLRRKKAVTVVAVAVGVAAARARRRR